MNLGIVLANTNRYDEALECYNYALTYRKKYPDCYYNLGNLVSCLYCICVDIASIYVDIKKCDENYSFFSNS